MSKTFTCQELGGVCDEKFSGETFDEIMQQAMPHLHQDEAHMANLKTLSETSGESKEEWMARAQKEFDERAED